MEDLIFLILCLLSIININLKGFNNFYYDYLDLKNSNYIKGIFVWMIILYHYRTYHRTNKEYIYNIILNYVGQKMVSLFLFYSGFGINQSIKIKGIIYVKTLPKKGTIIFIKSQIIILMYLLTNLILGIKTNLNNYFLSVIFKSHIGNSNWFAFSIISFYYYSYISFIFLQNKNYFYGIFFISIICYIHIYFVYYFYYPKIMHSVDNTLCFIIGFYYSLLKKYIDKILMKNDIFYFGIISSFIIIYYNFYICTIKTIWIASIINALFSFIIIFISMKVRFNNEFLYLLNKHSFSIYLLQRIVMRFIYFKKLFPKNEFIRFFFEFTAIIFISSTFDYYTSYIDKIFDIKKNNKNKTNKDEETIKIINDIK